MTKMDKEVFNAIKNKFMVLKEYKKRGTIKEADEKFSDRGYLEGLKVSENGDAIESHLANPDVLPESCSPYYTGHKNDFCALVDEVRDGMKSLTGKQRSAVTLLSHGFNVTDAAIKMGLSKRAFRTHLDRAIKKIKIHVAQKGS